MRVAQIKDKNLEEGLIVVSDISLEQGCARPHIRRSLTTQSNLPQLGSKLTSLRAGGKGERHGDSFVNTAQQLLCS